MGDVLGAPSLAEENRTLSERSRLFDQVLSSITDFVYIFDLEGRFTFINKPLLDLWGMTLDEAVGKNFFELPYPLELAAKLQDQIQQVIRTSERIVDETRYDSPTGSIGFYQYIFSPVFDAVGEVEAVAGTTRDITDRIEMEKMVSVQADQLAHESRLKDEFLAMLSHELRNPLAPLKTAVDLLKNNKTIEVRQQAEEILERQLKNLTRIVNDLLEVSRVVSGRIRLDLQETNLNQIVEHSIETARSLIDQRGHSLAVALSPEPLWARVDPIRMEEVFVNLLTNAAKYTRDGGLIEVFCEAIDDDHVRVRVRDSGVGIEPKLLPHIFDLFTQADRSLDRSEGGLGIGLNLAQRLAILHGGKVVAESPPKGKTAGSEFSVILPRIVASEAVLVPSIAATELSDANLRILVIDDNEDVVSMLTILLEMEGHTIRSAHDGVSGLDLAKEWVPDVIVLDIGLPGRTGYEVARELRAHEPTCGAKIIAVTGYAQDSDIIKAREAGFDFHLTKPYSVAELTKLFVSAP